MSAPTMHRYERQGLLAISPKAFGGMFPEIRGDQVQTVGNVAIVTIRGPLEQNLGWMDSYESILGRVASACASSADSVVLKINSPGGDVYGLFDAVRAVRSKCALAGKRLVAFVEGEACSAGYALACAASEIVVSDTSFVGSIGVLETRVDVSRSDAAQGVAFAITTSGSRKADRHPHVSLSDAELASAQQRVDSLASLFFGLVSECRSLSVETIEGLEAEVFHGAAAVSAGLADRVASFDALLALLASGEGIKMGAKAESAPKAGNIDDAIAALEKAAEGDGDEAERAREALKVLKGGGEEEEESDPDASKEDGEDGERAESEDEEKPSAARAPGRASAGGTSVALAASVQALADEVRQLKEEKRAAERTALFASRPDLSKELVLALKGSSLEECRRIIGAIKPSGARNPHAASASATGMRGAGVGGDAEEQAEAPINPLSEELDRAFGNGKRSAVSRTGTRRTFGVMSKEDALAKQLAPGKEAAK